LSLIVIFIRLPLPGFSITRAIHGVENIGKVVKAQIPETIDQAIAAWLRSALLMDVSGSKRQMLAETNCES